MPSAQKVARQGRILLRSLRGEGLGFVTLWPRIRNAVPGWLTGADARLLYALAHHGPGQGAIVEIGSAWGRSTILLATGSKRAGREKVYAIDPHTGQLEKANRPPEDHWHPKRTRGLLGLTAPNDPWYLKRDFLAQFGSLPGFHYNMQHFGVDDWVIPVVATSNDAVKTLDTGPIRLLYIDGLHTYEAVKTDISDWVPRVAPGGVVVFDDYHNEMTPGVRQAVDELLATGRVEPVLRRGSWIVWTNKR